MPKPNLTVDAIIFSPEGKLVVIRRGHPPFEGMYALPGGFVEYGETVEQACIRELEEETGLKVSEKDLRLVGVYSDPGRDPRGHTVSVVFQAESNLAGLQAGSDAKAVEAVENWEKLEFSFDHREILEAAKKAKK